MKLKIYSKIIVLVLAFCPLILFGQTPITGTITDADTGDPLIGASILVVGTNVGVISDVDGSYSIELPDGATQLTVSYTGYTPQTIDVGTSRVLDVQLTAGSLLDEVVVIGYGTVKREDATGAIQTVDSKVFNRGAVTSPQELLAGKVAGVQITTGAAPGDGAVIRIRGGSSISALNDPLIVIDGVPMDPGGVSGSRNALNFINPNDIATFTVLKDASATAIYGSRASNGVILITTKKGSLEKAIKINYRANVSFSNNIENMDVLTADQFRSTINEQFGEGHPARDIMGDTDTNWQNEIYETGIGTDHNLSLSGGIADILPYRVSIGYTDKKGILKTDEFKRTTAAINLSPGFLDNRLQVNFNFKSMFSDNRFANRGAIGSAVSFDPTQPVFDQASQYGGYFTWVDGPTGNPNTLAPANPVALLDLREDLSDVTRYVTSATVDYRLPFVEGLRANLNLAYDYSKGEGTVVVPDFASFAFNELNGGGQNNQYRQEKKNELLEFYLNYEKEWGDNDFDIMGGYSWQHNFFEDYSKNSDAAGTATETQEFESSAEVYLLSFFGRMNYAYKNKYLLTLTLRGDASSRFASENRWGLFPAAAFAWKILDGNDGTVNDLKLRLGYGVTGQQEIPGGFYPYLPVYTIGQNTARYQFGNDFVTTYRPEEYDANIKWEETTTYNVGLDFSLLNERIHGSIEYYQRETQDLINRIPVPAGTNLSNFISTNIGNLENKGIELTLNLVPVQKPDLTWDLGVNFTRNQNEVTKLTATDDPSYQGIFSGGISGGIGNTVQIITVGLPAYSFHLYEQVYDQDGLPIEGLYVDKNGDGRISPDDLYTTQQRSPDFFFGFNSTLTWKNFDFTFAGRANIGNYMYNNVQSDNAFYGRLYHSTNYLINVHSDISGIGFQNPQYLSDHFLQEASFLRLDHVTLSYHLSNLFNKNNTVTLTATMQNPLLVTDYTGLDPEIFSGIDSNIYPRSRTIVFGLNANF